MSVEVKGQWNKSTSFCAGLLMVGKMSFLFAINIKQWKDWQRFRLSSIHFVSSSTFPSPGGSLSVNLGGGAALGSGFEGVAVGRL